MEVAGLAIGAIASTHSLLLLTERVIKNLELLSQLPSKLVELVHELNSLRYVLLVVRDLIEQEATDDASVKTLSFLTRESRDLNESLENLESLSRKLSQSHFRQLRTLGEWKVVWYSKDIGRIQQSRQSLQFLLQSNELAPQPLARKSKRTNHKLLGKITGWLDKLCSNEVLYNLTAQYESGTGAWLLNNSSFLEWEENPGKTLWCSGLPGAGKSVLCSKVINHLREKFPSAKVPILFAFFDFRNASIQTPVNVVGSLLAQLIRQSHHISDVLRSLYERRNSSNLPPLEDLWSALYLDIASFDRVFIIVDALDEYNHGPDGFLQDFWKLLGLSVASLFVTSRPTSANKAILGDFAELEIRARDLEVRKYAQLRLSESRLSNRPELSEEILQTVVDRSGGMFLHARLLLDSILSQVSISSARRLLHKNQSLHTLYDMWIDRFMSTSSAGQSSYALEVLSWLAYARTPFTIGQLLEAVGIQIGSENLNPDDIPFIEPLERILAGLIFIEPARQQVSLVHYSLNEYLQLYLPKFKHLLPGLDDPQTLIVKKCLTCLRFKPFSLIVPSEQADLGDRLDKYAMLGYAARYWGEHAQNVSLGDILDEIMSLFDSSANTISAGLIMSIYEQHPGHYEQAYRGMLGLHISAYFGLGEVIEHMAEGKNINPDVATVGGWTALHWAARRGWPCTVSSLLKRGASTIATTKLDGWNALHLAAKQGYLDIVISLVGSMVGSKVDVNATDVQGRTPLYLATWAGHAEVVQYLLKNSANPQIPNSYGATALHCAAKRGHELIVRHLLDSGADINAVDTVGLTPLDEGIRRQNKAVIEVLIENGAKTTRGDDMQSSEKAIDDLDWETYRVNEEETSRIQKGSQCTCHVLEKSVNSDTSQSSLKVFRKTYSLSQDADGKVQKYFESERIILDRLRHPNVVTYWDFDEDPEQNAFLLYTEYCDLGDLNARHGRPQDTSNEDDEDGEYGFYPELASPTETNTTPLDGPIVWILVAQISSALAYLHYGLAMKYEAGNWSAAFESSWTNIIHRDIKPANIVMQSFDSNICDFKLCDLGIASEAGKGPGYNTTRLIGTQGFRPPEVLRNRPWTTKGDIWAFGETIRNTNKRKDSTFESITKQLIDRCTDKFPKRPSSLHIMEDACNVLERNDVLAILSPLSRLQIQATHALLGGKEGGYILKAFNLVAELLDDIVPFDDMEAKEHRRVTLERLDTLWKDGAESPFLRYLNEFSLHILVLLPLSDADRMKHLATLILSQPNLSSQWPRSRLTPLHLAAQAGRQEVVEYLLAHGASKDKLDLHLRTPASYANSANYPVIFSLLKPIIANEKKSESSNLIAMETTLSGEFMEKISLAEMGT